jgi:hypothetical protein
VQKAIAPTPAKPPSYRKLRSYRRNINKYNHRLDSRFENTWHSDAFMLSSTERLLQNNAV